METTLTPTESVLLPISIEVRGEIVSSNFPAFAEAVRARLGEINRTLRSDEDFNQADTDAKAIAAAEAALKAAKEKALADAEQLHALFAGIDGLGGELAEARIDLTKQITKRKEEVKVELIEEALLMIDIDPGLARKQFLDGLQAAIKGKRTLDSIRNVLRVYATTQMAIITKSREVLDLFEKAHGTALVMDRRELELRRPEEVEIELRRRWDLQKAEDVRRELAKEAEALKAEAAEARTALAESSKPPVPPASSRSIPDDSAPWSGTNVSPGVALAEATEREWKEFRASCLVAFAPLKAAREGLKNSRNIAKANVFANAINTAWKEVM